MKIRVSVSTNKVGSKCQHDFELDDDDLADMDAKERADFIEEMAREEMWGMVDWHWEEIE